MKKIIKTLTRWIRIATAARSKRITVPVSTLNEIRLFILAQQAEIDTLAGELELERTLRETTKA